MRVTRDGSVDVVDSDGSSRHWRTRSPLPAGLSARLVGSGGEGLRVQVFTGGPDAKRYVPAARGLRVGERRHAPVQVQATVSVVDGGPCIERLSAQYEFGPRGDELPSEELEVVHAEVVEFVTHLAAFCETFAAGWDSASETLEVVAEIGAGAERAAVRGDLERAVREVFASRGVAAPAELDEAGALTALSALAVPGGAALRAVPSGAEVSSAARDRLRAAAGSALGAQRRLSESEMMTFLVDRISAEAGFDDRDAVRAARAAYGAFHAAFYSTTGFPDRGAAEAG